MKLFLDANVLFSAANPESRLNRLFWMLARSHDLISSDYAREETTRNVTAKRADWAGELDRTLRTVRIVASVNRPIPVELFAKDRPILATAMRERCDRLVTGDKRHFGHLFGKTVEGVRVVTPLDLSRELYG